MATDYRWGWLPLRDQPAWLWVELAECAGCHRIRWCARVTEWDRIPGGLSTRGEHCHLCRPCLGRDVGAPIV